MSKNVSNIFIENNLHIRGPVQFKPVLLKGQLYMSHRIKNRKKSTVSEMDHQRIAI